MVLLQHKLSVKLSQRQILTPGLVQMVSVLALNKLELKDMINAEMVENPVLEELEESVPLLDEVGKKEEDRDRAASATTEENPITAVEKKDPFEEIDFGSFFQDYLDPGYRTHSEMEEIERPSFENFLSKPGNLTDHLGWQLGALSLRPEVREAADLIIGNLNEDGYLIASDEELLGIAPPATPEADAAVAKNIVSDAVALGLGDRETGAESEPGSQAEAKTEADSESLASAMPDEISDEIGEENGFTSAGVGPEAPNGAGLGEIEIDRAAAQPADHLREASVVSRGYSAAAVAPAPDSKAPAAPVYKPKFTAADLQEALEVIRQLDPPGVGCRDLRECLLYQLRYHQEQLALHKNGNGNGTVQVLQDATAVVDRHLRDLQNKRHKEIAKAINRPLEAVAQALEYIRTLDPRPGLRYNISQARLIEPDVAFVKHGDEWLVIMNDEDLPQLRLNPAYKKLATRDGVNEKSTRDYVKERYKSAIQLIKNIEQRKQTITKVCYCIVARQQDFLERGIDQLKPMMIKEVAEEIGVHPSTVSRAVANKYAHTQQGVFELRYFFSESVQGPEGGNTSLLILKRRVKKLIDEEDPSRPLTDEQITRILQSQGIQVTRRTVAKYREDMRIPSTHQRRVKK
jgi:RNA polymerase sigma-54 factor